MSIAAIASDVKSGTGTRINSMEQLADYILLWPEGKPGIRPLVRQSLETFAPRARVWLRSSQDCGPGTGITLRRFSEIWSSLSPGTPPVWSNAGVYLTTTTEPSWPGLSMPAHRTMRMASLRSRWTQAASPGVPSRVPVESPDPVFHLELSHPPSLRPGLCRPAVQGQTLQPWQAKVRAVAVKAPAEEPVVTPPVRTWVGAMNPAAPRLRVAGKKRLPLRTKPINSYRKRYASGPSERNKPVVFPPQPAMQT